VGNRPGLLWFSAVTDMMSPEEIEARKKADEINAGGSVDNSLITKSEMRSEMRCMIQELMGIGVDWPQSKHMPF
jgi:hypothetical protein